MPKKTMRRKWTKGDDRNLKALARKGTKKTTSIARLLKRTVGATYQRAYVLGVSFRAR
jgi:hypothetical protein